MSVSTIVRDHALMDVVFIVERSLFSLTPGVPFWKDWVGNRMLFWSVVFGVATIFPGE